MTDGKLRVAAITVSDTRTEADDVGGEKLRERLARYADSCIGHDDLKHRIGGSVRS